MTYAHISIQSNFKQPLEGGDKKLNERPAITAHTRYLSSLQPPDKEKHKVSCSCFLPTTKPMQHSRAHYNVFCRFTLQTRISLRTWQHNMATIMHSPHCDLQAAVQQAQRNTHTRQSTHCKTQSRNKSNTKTNRPQPPHTRCLSWQAAATLHGKTQDFVLRLPPQNEAHATFMQPLHCVCNHRFQNHSLQCIVMRCKVSHHSSLKCIAISATVSHNPHLQCIIVMWCKVTTLHCAVLLCSLKSLTTLHQVYC